MITVNLKITFTIFVCVLCSSVVYSYTPDTENIPKDVNILNYRAQNLAMKEDDYENLIKYLSQCLAQEKNTSFSKLCTRVIDIVSVVLKTNNPSEKQANQILLYISSIKNHTNHNNKRIRELVWLATLRNVYDKDILKNVLNSQKDTDMAEVTLALIGEFGWHDVIPAEKSVSAKIKNKDLFLRLLKRKAHFISSLNLLNNSSIDEIKNELALSINDVLPMINKGSKMELAHLNWLIKKMGLYRNNQAIKEILTSLGENSLHYNQSSLGSLSEDEKATVISLTNERLQISERSITALNPYLSEKNH
ncbi:hypothetical protein [Marinicella marina]|uniref:hypothetical protein n=1 Tax=Marinicella marina TaxID=2996016 RepID=UPI0024BC73E3|nr:hypothetical protein [Marinicella marina]MDJ1138796.1 hypothetical protein [Marinicella marina]